MSACKTLVRTSLSSISYSLRSNRPITSLLLYPSLRFSPPLSPNQGLRLASYNPPSRPYASISIAAADFADEAHSSDSTLEPPENPTYDTVEQLLKQKNDVAHLMKMERRPESAHQIGGRWFPYLDKFDCEGSAYLNSSEVLEALDPYMLDVRKERFRKAVKNRTYSVCLVVEGLGDFGNVSAAFRSADALGFQSVHVLSCDSSKRCNGI